MQTVPKSHARAVVRHYNKCRCGARRVRRRGARPVPPRTLQRRRAKVNAIQVDAGLRLRQPMRMTVTEQQQLVAFQVLNDTSAILESIVPTKVRAGCRFESRGLPLPGGGTRGEFGSTQPKAGVHARDTSSQSWGDRREVCLARCGIPCCLKPWERRRARDRSGPAVSRSLRTAMPPR